jgi:autotransporter strand-loop-strand O-heptosyltransferase
MDQDVAPAAFATSEDQLDLLSMAPAAEQKPEKKPPFPLPAAAPAQWGPDGIRYDFNFGARVMLPDGQWRVRLRDLDTGNVLFENENGAALVKSAKRFYVRFGIEVWNRGELVFSHDYDCAGRDVMIQFPIGTLGDTLAWFPYALRFAELHGCRLVCAMAAPILELMSASYPDITFVTHEELMAQGLQERAYATYYLGLFFDDPEYIWQPTDFRQVGLHKTAAYILGVPSDEAAPLLRLPDESRPIAEPYVCIAVQSTTQCKMWNNAAGWHEVIEHLKAAGYRVICIDKAKFSGAGISWTHIPHGAEDETGDRPLAERARWLRHASAFIGLSSGLSWLAWAAGTRVLLISGFTHPINEFATPYRVINWHTCNSCWNDPRERFDHGDYLWCPRHAGTARQFECTRLITSAQVISKLDAMLGTH